MPPFSSVYLIDGSGSTLMSRKLGNDGYPNYLPFNGAPDPPNLIHHAGSSIAAIICMDCDNLTLVQRMKADLAKAQATQIVCIPACMGGHYSSDGIAESWPSHYVILANSDPNGCKSFISKGGTIIKVGNRDRGNRITLCAL